MTTGDNKKQTIREAVAVFYEVTHLKEAVNALLAAGYSSDQIGLLASEHSVRESLGEFYTHTNNTLDASKAPVTAFVDKDHPSQQQQDSLGGSLFFVGTSGAMGAVVASSAVLGGALLAALSGVVAVGVIGAMAGKVIHQSDAEYLQQQIDEGHILLFVRLPESPSDPIREEEVLNLLRHHSGHSGRDVKVHEIKVNADV